MSERNGGGTLYEYLKKNGIISEEIERIADKTRDSSVPSVYKCRRTGVVFLEPTISLEESWFKKLDPVSELLEDHLRQGDAIREDIREASWLDFGAGWGNLVIDQSHLSKECFVIEPNNERRKYMKSHGIICKDSLNDIKDESLDVITLFHVIEHLTEPLETLKELRSKLKTGGRLIIETPNANDFLLQLKDFQDFTFWSEHVVLYNKSSLKRLLLKAGFAGNKVSGIQRYGFANHLGWMIEGKPGGDKKNFLEYKGDKKWRESYEQFLDSFNQTDTIFSRGVK